MHSRAYLCEYQLCQVSSMMLTKTLHSYRDAAGRDASRLAFASSVVHFGNIFGAGGASEKNDTGLYPYDAI